MKNIDTKNRTDSVTMPVVGGHASRTALAVVSACLTILLATQVYISTCQLVVVPGYKRGSRSSASGLRIQRSGARDRPFFTRLYGYVVGRWTNFLILATINMEEICFFCSRYGFRCSVASALYFKS